MDIGAIFLILAVLTLVGMYTAQPYLGRNKPAETKNDHALSALLAEYDRTVNSLQEMDFDNTLGKIPVEDYPKHRAEMLSRGAELLRQLDALQPQKTSRDTQSRIEAEVASRRADASANKPAIQFEDDDLEALIASRRKARKEKSAGFCPKCGKPILRSDRFCPSCGKAVT